MTFLLVQSRSLKMKKKHIFKWCERIVFNYMMPLAPTINGQFQCSFSGKISDCVGIQLVRVYNLLE